eukprot:Hpha_TRINITY_DN15191_c4_g2::TRINITY_DN15191_c4_g2_i2::g.128365::m.128365/K10357/MYO5; myosin V
MSARALQRQHEAGSPRRQLGPGTQVYFCHTKDSWQEGTVQGTERNKVQVRDGRTGEVVSVERTEVHARMEGAYDPRVPDLFGMGDLHQSTLLFCLKERYEKFNQMYTRMGEIVISINPFRPMDYNHPSRMGPHVQGGTGEEPHCWEVAHKAFKNIVVKDRGNQSILVSGESGAGKTETAKTLIDYLGQMSFSHSCNQMQRSVAETVNKKLKASNPILESFGNAKTSRNDNSSRFGKYIKLFFDRSSGVLTGAEMIHYLLEKSRIVGQNHGERGYHVFYEFLAGASPDLKRKLGNLGRPQDYASLNKGGVFERNSSSGGQCNDANEFKNLVQAMNETEISAQEQESIWAVLASILHLQNIQFVKDPKTDKAAFSSKEGIETVARLLQVQPAVLQECMLVKARTRIMTQMADVPEAMDMRDALSKALYSGVFDWLVTKINASIRPADIAMQRGGLQYIGLLDIFGFENFTKNSFEQFCINYTNESLQNHYNKYTFVQDAEECKREGIACPIVDYPDNQPCIDLLEMGAKGVMAILDAESNYKLGTDEGFTQKAWEQWGGNKSPPHSNFFLQPRSTVANQFSVKHYAAEVNYSTPGWIEKNLDTLKDDMREAIRASRDGFVGQLIAAPDGADGRKRPTVSGKFKKQLEELKRELSSTDSHFIRTVKPNPAATPGHVDNHYVMTQLACAGVIETIVMKRQGYPVRQLHKDFWVRYRQIAPRAVKRRFPYPRTPSSQELPAVCREICDHWARVCYWLKPPTHDIGHTKVFTKARVSEAIETARHRKIRRLLPRCLPYLRKWAQAFKKKKAEIEERRRRAQAEINATHNTRDDARRVAHDVGMDSTKAGWFKDMVQLFPHFDLPVILNVVQQAREQKQVMDFLLDMQKQRVAEALPAGVEKIFRDARLRASTQEELIRRGFTNRERLFGLRPDDMAALGFSQEERDALAAELLGQQSNWIVNQRLNVLMGAEGRDGDAVQRDLANLNFAADLVKRDMVRQIRQPGVAAQTARPAGSPGGYQSPPQHHSPPPRGQPHSPPAFATQGRGPPVHQHHHHHQHHQHDQNHQHKPPRSRQHNPQAAPGLLRLTAPLIWGFK